MSKKAIEEALNLIFSGIEKLQNAYPHRKFTIDGRLVGDIGEIIAERDYKITLDKKSKKDYDGTCEDTNDRVQIKATFKNSLTFKTVPTFYLGLKLSKNGNYEEIYNGPGQNIFEEFFDRAGIGEKQISLSIAKLQKLSHMIPEEEKIKKR